MSDSYLENFDVANIIKIYTSEQLLGECGKLSKPLPGRTVGKIKSYDGPTARDDYKWGWLKMPSTDVTLGGNKIDRSHNRILAGAVESVLLHREDVRRTLNPQPRCLSELIHRIDKFRPAPK